MTSINGMISTRAFLTEVGEHLLKHPADGPVGSGFVASDEHRSLGILFVARVQFLDERRGVHNVGADGHGTVLLDTNIDDVGLEVVSGLLCIDEFHRTGLRLLQAQGNHHERRQEEEHHVDQRHDLDARLLDRDRRRELAALPAG